MPRLGGPELAQKLRATRPGLRVLFATGYSSAPVDLSGHGNSLLQKPFNAATLLDRVRQALDG
jgi:FixJ family two-component response regulator